MHAHQCQTPIADALINLQISTRHSFHTLPVSKSRSLWSDDAIRDKYIALFGEAYLNSEMTVTGKFFDSFFFPGSVIRDSEAAAAELFGADGTLYVTTGTTTCNQIAARALYDGHGPVLIDRRCHQSIHFIFNSLGPHLDYISPEFECERSGRSAWNLATLLTQVGMAEAEDEPYEVIVLTAQSYEGVIYDIPSILTQLLDAGISTRKFLIDEAWGAGNYFHPALRPVTAMHLDMLMARYPDLQVVCTQSSHKSMSALRQASMIHFRGTPTLLQRLRHEKFRTHCTSPSYPILASLDLARAQMAGEGEHLMAQTASLAQGFCEKLTQHPDWSLYKILPLPNLQSMQPYVVQDPCKISIDITALDMPAEDIQSFLFHEHGLYISRITEHSILLNFHIGINADAVTSLLQALADLQRRAVKRTTETLRASNFIIPYPPGVPLVVPGEEITREIREKIRRIKRTGIAMLEV